MSPEEAALRKAVHALRPWTRNSFVLRLFALSLAAYVTRVRLSCALRERDARARAAVTRARSRTAVALASGGERRPLLL